MTHPAFSAVPVLHHEIHVTEWGRAGSPAIVMWHGLTRTGRDFDELASALSDRFHVLCPDTIGRGLSSWSRDPEREYALAHYVEIAVALLDHYGIDRAGWIGTSQGGHMGMILASSARANRLRWLIINDSSPRDAPDGAVAEILLKVRQGPEFTTLAEAETWLRRNYAVFGPAPDSFWHRMARTSIRRRDDGRLALHYDPDVAFQLSHTAHQMANWQDYDRIAVPTHVFRGAQSRVLSAEALERMRGLGPRPGTTVLDGCGHAPTLCRAGDIATVRDVIAGLEVRVTQADGGRQTGALPSRW